MRIGVRLAELIDFSINSIDPMPKLPQLRTKVPGPKSQRLAKTLKKYEAPTVTCITPRWPIFWKRAKGVNVWDVDGNRFLDLTSAFGVASLGYSHSQVTAAIQRQSSLLCHSMGDVHPAELKAQLCAKLSKITYERWTRGRSSGQVLLCNSGFEAVEAALKTACLFTQKRGVIAFEGAYHGLGYGALDTTWRNDFRAPFLDQLGHFTEFVPYPRKFSRNPKEELKKIETRIRNILQHSEIGAILVEPFQGRGGDVIPPDEFIPILRRLCDHYQILLIVDEIYVGFWRTGRWFGVDHSKVIPDLICLGKALTGCLPLSACVGRANVMSAWPQSKGESLHTSTFLGNPIACAAALASILEFQTHAEKWSISEKGDWILEELSCLAQNPYVKEIRGIGLMVGIEFSPEAPLSPSELCERLLQRGIIALPSGSRGETLSLAPPLRIEKKLLRWSIEQIASLIPK